MGIYLYSQKKLIPTECCYKKKAERMQFKQGGDLFLEITVGYKNIGRLFTLKKEE